MPFQSSYQDFEKMRYLNAREQFMRLGQIIVRDPLSTHIIKVSDPAGKTCFLVVDRARLSVEGDLALLCTVQGLRFGKVKQTSSAEDIWGKVMWTIKES
jgi:hypothetical protein